MPIQYKPSGFPDKLTCPCGSPQSIREAILEADRIKTQIDKNFVPQEYFSAFTCNTCSKRIWYTYLDYSDDVRIIELLKQKEEPSYHIKSVEKYQKERDTLRSKARKLHHTLDKKYSVELEFPASIMVRQYLQYHQIDYIMEDIYENLPLIVMWKDQIRGVGQNIILVIPYQSNGDIYGEIKVNFNLSLEDREAIGDLAFCIWDLVDRHHLGKIHEIPWNLNSILELSTSN